MDAKTPIKVEKFQNFFNKRWRPDVISLINRCVYWNNIRSDIRVKCTLNFIFFLVVVKEVMHFWSISRCYDSDRYSVEYTKRESHKFIQQKMQLNKIHLIISEVYIFLIYTWNTQLLERWWRNKSNLELIKLVKFQILIFNRRS